MLEPLIFSLITAIAVGLSAGYVGSLMVLEKMALVGDALSHVALPGLAIGILLGFPPQIGAFAFLFVSAILIWQIGRTTKLPFDAIVGAMFTLSLAIGIILIGEPDLLEALFGDITTVTIIDTTAAVLISAAALLLTKAIYNRLVLGLISEDLAISKGIDIAKNNLLYLLLVSLIVAIGIKIVGTLLVGFLVIVPAAAARTVSANLGRYSWLSSIFGAISASSGILLSGYFNQHPGPLVVFAGIAIFLIVMIFRWRKK
jgi:ABC-type Mn2+/Zn2+ transport system permease subunit